MALKNTSSNLTFSASSIIEDTTVINFSANSYAENQLDFSMNVCDFAKYIANKEEVATDITEFIDSVTNKLI